jgi:N6-adenosine-specific RNA methylase IME4
MKYRTIVADPPWAYERTGLTFTAPRGGRFVGHGLPYASLSPVQIALLPVADIAEDDAHLYLWTTQRYLRPAHDIAEGWGFQPAATLVWCKPPRGFALGGTFMSTTEFVLFCRRGSLPAKTRIRSQWFDWPRSAHSAKPEAFIDMVEQVSPPPYVELFARRHRLGWDVWGNESANTAQLGAVS